MKTVTDLEAIANRTDDEQQLYEIMCDVRGIEDLFLNGLGLEAREALYQLLRKFEEGE